MKVRNFKPYITGNEITYIQDIIGRGFDMSGDGIYTKRVHSFLERKYKTNKALLTTSGTAALEFAVRLLKLVPGDEVILPSYTFSSTANAVLINNGLKVVFADIDKNTLNIDPNDIERKITKNTKAIIVVHYAGVACDMDRIMKIAKKYNLKVIEDAAQGIEAKYKGKYLGTIGDFGCISFHDTKNITAGEAGALFVNTQDKEIIERAEIVREKGTNRTKFFRGEVDKYTWVEIGSSYLPSDILAAFLLAQLENAEKITKLRKQIFNQYKKRLAHLERDGLIKLPFVPQYTNHNAHIFYVIFNNEEIRDYVMAYLRKKGVSAPFHYVPLHSSPIGISLGYKPEDLPITEDLSYRLIRLPIFAEMKKKEVDYVIRNLERALYQYEAERPSVTVGISAFNEGKNIRKIVNQILMQNENGWRLREVIVMSDGSSDNTVSEVQKINDERVKIFEDHKRFGKSYRINQILKKSKGEITVLFDGDIKIGNEAVISSLVEKFREENVMVVGGNTKPFTPKTFFEKAVYSTFLVFEDSRMRIKNGNNIFGCTGGCMAIRKRFAKQIEIPSVINDDDFIYFSCIKAGFEFRHASDAEAYYKLPKTLKDYLKQVFRSDPHAVSQNFTQYFGNLVKDEYKRPLPFYMHSILKSFIKNPIGVTYMIFVNVVCVPLFPVVSKRYKLDWFRSISTK